MTADPPQAHQPLSLVEAAVRCVAARAAETGRLPALDTLPADVHLKLFKAMEPRQRLSLLANTPDKIVQELRAWKDQQVGELIFWGRNMKAHKVEIDVAEAPSFPKVVFELTYRCLGQVDYKLISCGDLEDKGILENGQFLVCDQM